MSNIDLSKVQDERAKEDILELHNKIESFNKGEEDEEKFRSFRLARGVYGQRQEGVQMIRIKLPYGKVTANQLIKIADVADKYASEKMHATTRQDIQIHYVKLAESPKLWAELEEEGITLKEACGNTVRNVTAAPVAGIDPEEPFDVSPYAHTFFEYFLRNPICQEMGRKFKVSFSTNEKWDNGFGFMHDIGFLPKIENGVKGFKVVVGGGLGAQPMLAHTASEFLPAEQMIPFAEAVIRVFDRHGERASRGKARMKFLIKKIGFEAFMALVEEQRTAVISKTYPVDENIITPAAAPTKTFDAETPVNAEVYEKWRKTNVLTQKQDGLFAVSVKLLLGNIFNETARKLAAVIKEGYAADDIRVTVNQDFVLRHVKEENLPSLFNKLYALDLTDLGYDTTQDIIACPGTDTCNLGIASSTGAARELERVMREEYPDLIYNNDIKIKISGCMNACGQHSIANIGFQGMSIKKGPLVMPAMQILLGGGFDKDGNPSIGDKVVKVPSKRVPAAFSAILEDYDSNSNEGEYFNNYYKRQVEADKMYFFTLLKPFSKVEEAPEDYFVDWGHSEKYEKAVGVGECAGVILDLVGTLILEAEEKFANATNALAKGSWQDSIYHAYNTFVVGAKALLIGEGIQCNTHINILNDFDTHFIQTNLLDLGGKSFIEHATQLNRVEPTEEFAQSFYADAKAYIALVKEARDKQINRQKETV